MTQLEIVKQKLKQDNYISRNWCLRNNITRLGALINKLTKKGFEIEGKYFKTDVSKDYIYTMKEKKGETYEVLNNRLAELIKIIPVKWENYQYIEEAKKAIKIKHGFYKKNIIKKISEKFGEKSL